MNSIRVNYSGTGSAGQKPALTFFSIHELEAIKIPPGFFHKFATLKKEIGEYFSFPGIVEVTDSKEGNITDRYVSFYSLLFESTTNNQKYGFLFGVNKNQETRILGVFPFSFLKQEGTIIEQGETFLAEILANPGHFTNVNVVSSF